MNDNNIRNLYPDFINDKSPNEIFIDDIDANLFNYITVIEKPESSKVFQRFE